jgi:uncharacterized protein DUF1761
MRVNYLAVLVAGIVFFGWGALWYTVFGKQWVAAVGVPHMTATGAAVWYPYLVSFIMTLLAAYALARVLAGQSNVSVGVGAWMGFMLGLLVFGAIAYEEYIFEQRTPMLAVINIGYASIGMAIVGAILGMWKPRSVR